MDEEVFHAEVANMFNVAQVLQLAKYGLNQPPMAQVVLFLQRQLLGVLY